MTKLFTTILILIANIAISQENDLYGKYVDSLLDTSVKGVSKVNKDSISTLLVYFQVDYHQAKGFLVENNIPGGTININDSIPTCPEECDVRMRMTHISDSTFLVEFKFRDSKEFITDTCYVFELLNQSYFAIPKSQYNGRTTLRNVLPHVYMGPASTDERDVIRICISEAKQTVFYPLY